MNKPTIVAPGGSYEKAMIAANYGAEEVYVGVPFTSLRMRQNKVTSFETLKTTVDDLHALGTKALLTMNIFPRNQDIKLFEEITEKIASVGADAIIFSDLGTFNIIRKYFPNTPLHLSTQTSTLNYEAIKFWRDLGIKRIVLARELHIDEIKEIKKQVPDVELEIFAHGAMCMSYSGRCLLGDYMGGRQANKGECNHACRFKYNVWLEEERRPGKFFQMKNDEGGVHILSSKDLCTINRLEEVLPYVDALKIEGRSKSEFYVGSVVKAYKHVRDAILNGTEINPEIKDLVNKIPHRAYRDGFLFNKLEEFPEKEEDVTEENTEVSTTLDSAGPLFARNYYGIFKPNFIEKDGKKYYEFNPKEVIEPGMKIKYLTPNNVPLLKGDKGGSNTLEILGIIKEGGQELEKAHCNTPKVFIHTNQDLQGREILYK